MPLREPYKVTEAAAVGWWFPQSAPKFPLVLVMNSKKMELNTQEAFMSIDTSRMTQRIEDEIQRATHGNIAYLEVADHDDAFVLRGCCPTFSCKKLAQDAALALIGDTTLINQIQVR